MKKGLSVLLLLGLLLVGLAPPALADEGDGGSGSLWGTVWSAFLDLVEVVVGAPDPETQSTSEPPPPPPEGDRNGGMDPNG